MTVQKIRLKQFRNYGELSLNGFSPGLNLIRGKNAQGKTNLIEAVHICANGKSFRTPYDHTAIMHGAPFAYMAAEYAGECGFGLIEGLIEKNKKKSFKINGVPLKSAKQLIGNLLTVVFSPEDIRTAKESPALRRSFLDSEISKLRPSYVDALKKYAEITAQKNAALRGQNYNTQDLLRAYNARLKDYIEIIGHNRRSYVKRLNEILNDIHGQVSGSGEDLKVFYETQVEEDIEAQLESLLRREMAEQCCNSGPHRDDVKFTINGTDARQYASQGQLRTIMLSAKIACVKIIEQNMGKKPVLLLDDVFSELDASRKENLIKAIGGVQTFITGCGTAGLNFGENSAVIEVERGTAKIL